MTALQDGTGEEQALLPRTLLAALAQELLPHWLCEEVGLPEGETLGALGAGRGPTSSASARAHLYAIRLLESRRDEIAPRKVLAGPWPIELDPERVPWPTRARRGLARAGLLRDALRLAQVTYGELFAIPQMGAKSVLECALTVESAVDRFSRSEPFPPELAQMIRYAADSHWAELISGEDPRFGDLLDPEKGTLAQQLDEIRSSEANAVALTQSAQDLATVLPAVIERVAQCERTRLDDALREVVAGLSGFSGTRLEALLKRYGFSGEPPWTLQRVAELLGVTRERVRQLQMRVSEALPSHPLLLPALDRALDLIAKAAPASPQEIGRLLRDEGITRTAFHPVCVLAAADFCGRPATFEVEAAARESRVVTTPMLTVSARINLIAARQSDSFGASNVAELVTAIVFPEGSLTEAQAHEALSQYSDAVFLTEEWFWIPTPARNRNRLYNVTRRILSVASPLDVATIRDGARRAYRFREVAVLPPRAVMAAFFEHHPEFEVQADGLVRPASPLDYRAELGRTEQILVDVLRAAPTGVLDRWSLQEGCEARGMNPNTFSVYSSYSPVLDHLGTDLWALRGIQVNPAAVDALRRANAARPRDRVVEDYGWADDGTLWVAARVRRRQASPVIAVPSPIANYVADRRFTAHAEDGSAAGTIAVNLDGVSWGYGPFLNRRGADEGDVLRVDFDLTAGRATLRLGDSDLFD